MTQCTLSGILSRLFPARERGGDWQDRMITNTLLISLARGVWKWQPFWKAAALTASHWGKGFLRIPFLRTLVDPSVPHHFLSASQLLRLRPCLPIPLPQSEGPSCQFLIISTDLSSPNRLIMPSVAGCCKKNPWAVQWVLHAIAFYGAFWAEGPGVLASRQPKLQSMLMLLLLLFCQRLLQALEPFSWSINRWGTPACIQCMIAYRLRTFFIHRRTLRIKIFQAGCMGVLLGQGSHWQTGPCSRRLRSDMGISTHTIISPRGTSDFNHAHRLP